MPEQDNWKEWVVTLSNSKNPHDKELLIAKIEVLLSSQAHALKEQMKACVPKQQGHYECSNWEHINKDVLCPDCEWKITRKEMWFNDCREQTLSAIESIEI